MSLGQSSATLSGGEAKILASFIGKGEQRDKYFSFDELLQDFISTI